MLLIGVIGALAIGFVFPFGEAQRNTGFLVGASQLALAEEMPVGTTPESNRQKRKNYFPNTEELGPDEMRVIALGTGTPNFRHSQASSAWLVELGNGEKFIFDIGSGSLANLAALEIPYAYLDKIFISHLHVDHIGDLDEIFIGGWVSNRTGPLKVWGPSGLKPQFGTRYAVERLQEMFTWDLTGRRGNMPSAGGNIEVIEFDYSKSHIVYEENGVKIEA